MTDQRSSRRPFVWLLPLALASFAGCKANSDKPEPPMVTVQTAHPTLGPISEEVAADAILSPLSQAAIAPRISAPILHEYVQRGQRVRQGQLLVTLQNKDLVGSATESRGAVVSAQAALTSTVNATIPEDINKAETDLAQARAARDVAARTAAERKNLFEQGALSGRDADTAYAAAVQAQAAYDVAARHLESVSATTRKTSQQSAEGQLLSAQGRFTSAEAQASFAQLRSPINGVVTERPLFPGETAQSGSTVITVMDTSSLLAKLHLSQSAAQKLQIGHKAEVTVPGIDDPVEGTVAFLSPTLDPGSTTVEVWVKLHNAEGSLKVGTPVHIVLNGATIPKALQVPPSAIVPSTDGSTAVAIVGSDGTAHKQPVKVGIRTPESVQIVSGLAATDNVITEGGYGLDDGTKVRIGKPGSNDEDKDVKSGEDKD